MNTTIQEIRDKFEELKGQSAFLSDVVINRLEVGTNKFKKKFLKCQISDKDGGFDAKMWDEPTTLKIQSELEDISEKEGKEKKSFVADVKVQIKEFNGSVDLNIETIEPKYDKKVFSLLEKAKIDANAEFKRLLEYVNQVEHEGYKTVLLSIFDKEFDYPNEEVKQKCSSIRYDFLASAAATGHHHNYIHGLLEHSLNVLDLALFMADKYKDYHEYDRNLLITAGLLHDIGKIYEYLYEEGVEYSDEGPFVYHTVSGSMLFGELVRDLELDMNRKDLMKVVHLITSHHGEYAEHSPNQHCIEAHYLALADNADAKANGTARMFEQGRAKKMRTRFS